MKNLLFNSLLSFSKTPTITSIPEFCISSIPFPATSEKESTDPITTFGILCFIIRSEQGGVFPKCTHGSKFTYRVAFLSKDLSFTFSIALTSA